MPDLAVAAGPAERLPALVEALGRHGDGSLLGEARQQGAQALQGAPLRRGPRRGHPQVLVMGAIVAAEANRKPRRSLKKYVVPPSVWRSGT